MTIDIIRLDDTKPINNKNAVLSTTPTGYSSIRNIRFNYPVNLNIANIENKYSDRFDDITYYTLGRNNLIGA